MTKMVFRLHKKTCLLLPLVFFIANGLAQEKQPMEEGACAAEFLGAQGSFEQANQLQAQKRFAEAIPLYRDVLGKLSVMGDARCPEHVQQVTDLQKQALAILPQLETLQRHQTLCQPNLDAALDFDIKGSSAKRENKEPAEIEKHLGQAEEAWKLAAASCMSPQREKAERNLLSTQRARAANAERLNSSPACESAWKNAGGLVDLAKGASKDKQWEEAASFYQKAGLAWERAVDACSGIRKEQAEKKALQSELDAHNTEFCAPQWEAATELSQNMKTRSNLASVAEREENALQAEIAWRDAILLCKGQPQVMAKNNADAIARERGTPMTAAAKEKYSKKPQTLSGGDTLLVKPVDPVNVISPAPKEKPVAPIASMAGTVTPVEPIKALPKRNESNLIKTAEASYKGNFESDKETGKISGSGLVEWINGDKFTGDLQEGVLTGKGRYVWKNGTIYEGQFQKGAMTGRGVLLLTDGTRYEGQVINGVQHGQGTTIFPSGDKYSGTFVQGLFHGKGIYTWVSGGIYEGDWFMGKKHGQGKLTTAGGVGWEGEFKEDAQTDNVTRFVANKSGK